MSCNLRNVLLLSCVILSLLLATEPASAFYPDFNSDNMVSAADLSIWLQNFGQTGATFPMGDVDGDTNVGNICDGSALLQWWGSVSPSPGNPTPGVQTGSTGTASATYDPILGTGTVTVTLGNGLGVGGIYLVNTSGGAITSSSIPGFPNPDSGPPFGFPGARALSFLDLNDTIGLFPASISFTVTPATPITNLRFYYARLGQLSVPMPIQNLASGTTFTTTQQFPCDCIPEPSTALLTPLMGVALLRRRLFGRRRHAA